MKVAATHLRAHEFLNRCHRNNEEKNQNVKKTKLKRTKIEARLVERGLNHDMLGGWLDAVVLFIYDDKIIKVL